MVLLLLFFCCFPKLLQCFPSFYLFDMEPDEDNSDVQFSDATTTNRKRKAVNVSTTRKEKCKTRKWSDVEVDELIDMLEERVCLWDVFHKEYHLRNKREKAFEEMEENLEISIADIKTKIASLRAQLGRELTKTKAKKSGQALSENYKSNWIYWDRLQFLVAVMQAGKSKDNLPAQERSLSPELDAEGSPDSVDAENNKAVNLDDDSPFSRLSSETPKPGRGPRAKICSSDSDTRKELLSTCIQVLKEPMPQPQSQSSPFSLYVAEKLSHLDRRNRMIAEKRISDILFEIEMNAEQSGSFQQSNWQTSESPVAPSGTYMNMVQGSQTQYRRV